MKQHYPSSHYLINVETLDIHSGLFPHFFSDIWMLDKIIDFIHHSLRVLILCHETIYT